MRKEEKKHPKKKNKVIQVPNICPFKEDILRDCERLRKLKEEEKQKQRDAAKERRRQLKEAGTKNLETLVSYSRYTYSRLVIASLFLGI